jgi:hypothetical protein
MSSTDSNDRIARNKGSLLDRIEERSIQDGKSLGDHERREEETPDPPMPPAARSQPPEEPGRRAPASRPDDDLSEDAPPARKTGGLLDRLSRMQVEPSAERHPAPEEPSEVLAEQPPAPAPAQEAVEGMTEDAEDLPGFLRELDDAFASQPSAESRSIFDETLPISPEAQQMMADMGGAPLPPSPASASEIPSTGPFSSSLDEVAFEDATPPDSPTGGRVLGAGVDEAMERLREKMAKVAMEFAEGKINQSQFQAIYNRYQEQRVITEQLLARDPTTDAWQQVLTEGHTTFLRARFEARVMGYTLQDNRTGETIVAHGHFGLSAAQLAHLLQSFYSATAEAFGGGMRSTVIEDGRWVLFVPGRYTTGIVIFTLQPSEGQLRLVSDLHDDFERANEPALASGNFAPESLVYPQRFLLQDTDTED